MPGNTQLGDFLSALAIGAASTGRQFDPQAWSTAFLETAGLNTVAAELVVRHDRIESLTLVQSAPTEHAAANQLRAHLLQVGVYDAADDSANDASATAAAGKTLALRATHEVRLSASEARTDVAAVRGQRAPAFVFANEGDHGYIKVELDARSSEFALHSIGALRDPLARQLVWQSLWNACRDANLSSIAYLALCRQQVEAETDPQVLNFILTTAGGAAANYVPRRLVEAESDAMFAALVSRLQATPAEQKALQVGLADQVCAFAASPAAVAQLVPLLAAGATLGTYAFGQAQRWRIVVRACAHALDGHARLLAAECARDRTDVGARSAASARVAVPDANVKSAAWARWHSAVAYEQLSTYELKAEMAGFGIGFAHQHALLASYEALFFAEIRDVYRTKSKGYFDSFFQNLFPFDPESDSVLAAVNALIASLDGDKVRLDVAYVCCDLCFLYVDVQFSICVRAVVRMPC